MATNPTPTQSSLTLVGTLAEAWSLPASEQFPTPSAGAAIIVGGRLLTLYGDVLSELVGKPEGTRVAVLLDPLPDREA